jgi:nucleotidyltransferase AbiEii toxin of type IV toxin-antitoxin system
LRRIDLPALRPGAPPVRILGYPIETVLAEKIATAIALGAANTRVRDYADIYTLTGRHDLTHATMREALLATAAFRATALQPLSEAVDNLVALRSVGTTYRTDLGPDGGHLPSQFADVVATAIAFADPLIASAPSGTIWQAGDRRWST